MTPEGFIDDLIGAETASLPAYLAGLAIGTWVHEFAHAGMGWLVGFHPRSIRIGTGRILFRTRIRSAWLVVRLWPISGAVASLPRPPDRVGATVAVLLAGFSANAVVLAGALALSRLGGAVETWVVPIGAAQAIIIACTALPVTIRRNGVRRPTDMLKALRLLRGVGGDPAEAQRVALLARVLPDGATMPDPSPETPEILYQIHRGDRLTDAWARQDAYDVLRQVLDRNRLPPAERAAVLVALVRSEVLFGDTGLPPDRMEAWSSDAVAIADVPRTRITRAGALVALGRLAEADALLAGLGPVAEASGDGAAFRLYAARADLARVDLAGADSAAETAPGGSSREA